MSNDTRSPDSANEYKSAEFEAAYAIAKSALGLVGRFRTPPTPEIYELWYRYAEGNDEALCSRVAFLIEDLQSAKPQQIEELRQQFFPKSDADSTQNAVSELIDRMSGLQSIMSAQASAGDVLDASLTSVQKRLAGQEPTAKLLQQCMTDVLASNDEMRSQLKALRGRLDESEKQVSRLQESLLESHRTMMTDPLTGVGNRRMFNSLLQQAVNYTDRKTIVRTLLLVDLDNFKHINDTFGHDSGDAVVKRIATVLDSLAENTTVARYGGDEFAVFLSSDSADGGKQLADHIAETVFGLNLKVKRTAESIGRLSTSIGVAILRPGDDGESWFQRADQLLYLAKTSGRNTVMVERDLD